MSWWWSVLLIQEKDILEEKHKNSASNWHSIEHTSPHSGVKLRNFRYVIGNDSTHPVRQNSITKGATSGPGTAFLPEHLSSTPPVISGVPVAKSLVFCIVFCRSLFDLFLLLIVLSVRLWCTTSDYPFGILKLPPPHINEKNNDDNKMKHRLMFIFSIICFYIIKEKWGWRKIRMY